jgi:ABC-type phosphate/phosphonate transport system substrate-binding protein
MPGVVARKPVFLRPSRWDRVAHAFGSLQARLVRAQQVFRVTTIPEEAATEQVRKFGPMASLPGKKLGMKVEFTPVSDYPAAVEALVNKKVDLVWFGGFTFVQASIRSGGKIIPWPSARKTPSSSRCSSPRPIPASRRWPT